MTKKVVIYTRVSTSKQGVSGLGLDAQLDLANSYITKNNYRVTATFSEVQSGGKSDRAKLTQALDYCKATDSTLIVASLSRISRDVNFITKLQDSGINFICADMPEANKAMVQFMAVFAEYEKLMISKRTKDALKAKRERIERDKKQGLAVKELGHQGKENLTKEGRAKGSKNGTKTLVKKANIHAKLMSKYIHNAVLDGATSAYQIQKYFAKNEFLTQRKNQYSLRGIKNLIEKCLSLGLLNKLDVDEAYNINIDKMHHF